MATGASGGAFPAGFTWGAASSSYQIEGAATADGKGPSIWDSFCRHPGAVHQGDTGDVACDHYHRMPEDAALMAAMGLQAYRFSVSWPRVMPEGTGKINEAGLGFYDRLVDALLARGIEPWVTLFHWDYPLALYHRGGWLNRETAAWFAEYAQVVVDRLSDRVRHWMTINEPQIFIGLGHLAGINAPGLKLQTAEWLLGAHHSLLSTGARRR
jgi:beta-glucosidase